jgi:hypothetical protein
MTTTFLFPAYVPPELRNAGCFQMTRDRDNGALGSGHSSSEQPRRQVSAEGSNRQCETMWPFLVSLLRSSCRRLNTSHLGQRDRVSQRHKRARSYYQLGTLALALHGEVNPRKLANPKSCGGARLRGFLADGVLL